MSYGTGKKYRDVRTDILIDTIRVEMMHECSHFLKLQLAERELSQLRIPRVVILNVRKKSRSQTKMHNKKHTKSNLRLSSMIADQLPQLSRSIIDKVVSSASSQSLGVGSTSRRAAGVREGSRKKQKSCPRLCKDFFCPTPPSKCVLSQATHKDRCVVNDYLKVVVLGDLSTDKSRLALAITGGIPERSPVSATRHDESRIPPLDVIVHNWIPEPSEGLNFSIWEVIGNSSGANHSVQALLFSPKSLYILLWDLGVSKLRRDIKHGHDHQLELDWNNHVKKVLTYDIQERILPWIHQIICHHGTAILPVACVADGMQELEVQRRCTLFKDVLNDHWRHLGNPPLSQIFWSEDHNCVMKVNLTTGKGLPEMKDFLKVTGTNQFFSNIGLEVQSSLLIVLGSIRTLKHSHNVISVEQLLSEMNDPTMSDQELTKCLQFLSSIGEILYFGKSSSKTILCKYIVLSSKWLVSALSYILHPEWQRMLAPKKGVGESDIVQTLLGQATSRTCPMISAKEAAELWKSMSFMKEAGRMNEQDCTPMNEFLIRLLVASDVFFPLNRDNDPIFLVPALANQTKPKNIWTYKTCENQETVLCQSWFIDIKAVKTAAVMDHVMASLLKDIYEFVHTLNITVQQATCFKSSILIKTSNPTTEIFVTLVDGRSSHCVDTQVMGYGCTKRQLIVSGRESVGSNGCSLFTGVYGQALNSIRAYFSNNRFKGVIRRVVCPQCLATVHPSDVSTWSWNQIQQAVSTNIQQLPCSRNGHLIPTSLLCGTIGIYQPTQYTPNIMPVHLSLQSVVVVLVWNFVTSKMISLGSGFLVDQELGLIVTASHVLYDMKSVSTFGCPFFGGDSKVLIGIIPEGKGSSTAEFQYFATVVSQYVNHVDACVLQIVKNALKDGTEAPLTRCSNPALKLTEKLEEQQFVRLLGFSQDDLSKGLNHVADFAYGYVIKKCLTTTTTTSTSSGSPQGCPWQGSKKSFCPLGEINVRCPTIPGHSGGPFINAEGDVIGMLSRADSADLQECYLVPVSEMNALIAAAKCNCDSVW